MSKYDKLKNIYLSMLDKLSDDLAGERQVNEDGNRVYTACQLENAQFKHQIAELKNQIDHNDVSSEVKLDALKKQIENLTWQLDTLKEISSEKGETIKGLEKQVAELTEAKPITWHPADERPERWDVLVERTVGASFDYLVYTCLLPDNAVRWCYVDELIKVIK